MQFSGARELIAMVSLPQQHSGDQGQPNRHWTQGEEGAEEQLLGDCAQTGAVATHVPQQTALSTAQPCDEYQ